MRHAIVIFGLLLLAAPLVAEINDDRTTETFGELRLIDEVIPGQEKLEHRFSESMPGISKVEQVLGKPTRIITPQDEAVYVAMVLGAGKGLKANHAYVLEVDYPEDAPRSVVILNRGAEMTRGFYTGQAVGDALQSRHANSNTESLKYPLSGAHEAIQMLFYLQQRYPAEKMVRGRDSHSRSVTPEQGVPVLISQFARKHAPLSQGAAFSRIALYEVVNPDALDPQINYPPDDLPRRHLFWREEMSDGVVDRGDNTGFDNSIDWYRNKARMAQFLGMNTFANDLLEFGHNQGWDAQDHRWINASHEPHRWENILKMLRSEGFDMTVLPYYEYVGSIGPDSPGTRKLARPLGDSPAYTHVTWSEKAYADITEPVILEDAKKVLDLTIQRWKSLADFDGAWFRVRPSHIPVSFSDNALAKFSQQRASGRTVTRAELQQRGELYDAYIDWWLDQRKAFFVELSDHLRQRVGDNMVILFTADVTEGGLSLPGGRHIVTDDTAMWQRVVKELGIDHKVRPIGEVIANNEHLKAAYTPRNTWGQWEWDHAVPIPDPLNYKDTTGVLLTYTFNRVYTVSNPKAFDDFRNDTGLAIVRHYKLNEYDIPEDLVGYFVTDFDRTGAYQMHAEVLAMAHGDPTYLGYLCGHNFNRGFPYYARRFNKAFLALPALPSKVVKDAASDGEVVVRLIQTDDHGSWLSIANTGMDPKPGVTITLPVEGTVIDATTGQTLTAEGGKLLLDLDAAELRAIRIQ